MEAAFWVIILIGIFLFVCMILGAMKFEEDTDMLYTILLMSTGIGVIVFIGIGVMEFFRMFGKKK